MCAINPAVGALNQWITDVLNSMGETSKIILGCIVAGMMAIDMGGPFNKAAYVFGTAAITTGGFDIMAAVMIGGMVPPIAIALCATFFKRKWTATELKSAPVNYVMGLCFITEGAIPYAASDPFRVIPSCIVGSAIAGGISMAFGCTLESSPRRYLRIPCSRKCDGICDSPGSGGSSRHDNAGAPEEECSGKGGRIIESNGTMVNGG